MANKLLLVLLVLAGACVIAWSGYQFGRHLAARESPAAAPDRSGR